MVLYLLGVLLYDLIMLNDDLSQGIATARSILSDLEYYYEYVVESSGGRSWLSSRWTVESMAHDS